MLYGTSAGGSSDSYPYLVGAAFQQCNESAAVTRSDAAESGKEDSTHHMEKRMRAPESRNASGGGGATRTQPSKSARLVRWIGCRRIRACLDGRHRS